MKPPAPGRPPDVAKRHAILDAAKVHISEVGFEAAAIEVIAARAGVSKVTVYRQFVDKTGLFVAIVDREADRLTARIQELPQGEGQLLERLVTFGQAMVGLIFDPEQVAFEAAVQHQVKRHPELGERFFAAGPERLRSQLAQMLVEAAMAGQLRALDADNAAEHLMALIVGYDGIRLRFLPADVTDPRKRTARVQEAVEVFLRAYGPAAATVPQA